MQTKHKVAIGVVVMGAIGAGVAGCLIIKQPCTDCLEGAKINISRFAESSVAPLQLSLNSNLSPTSNLLYKNLKYGFQMTFSDVWTGYVINETPNPAETNAAAKLDVVVPNVGVAPLTIYVYPVSASQSGLIGTQLSQNTQYVFTYRTDDNLSSSSSTITEREIADRLKTFVLIN